MTAFINKKKIKGTRIPSPIASGCYEEAQSLSHRKQSALVALLYVRRRVQPVQHIYISGPITNEGYSRGLFADAEKLLKNKGYCAINSSSLHPEITNGESPMARNLTVLGHCDALVIVGTRSLSYLGRKIEGEFAKAQSIPIYENIRQMPDLIQVKTPEHMADSRVR